MENFNKGEKLLMYVIDEDVITKISKDPIKYGEYFIDSPCKEVTAERLDNVLDFDIITVIDSDGNKWCGTHIEDYELGRIRFIRKEERIHALRDAYDALYVDLKAADRYERLQRLMDVMESECDHLFVTLKNRCDHELPVVECVHCGLTNKWEAVREKDEDYVTHDGKLQLYEFNKYLLRTVESTGEVRISRKSILSYGEHKFNDLKMNKKK